MQLRTVDPTYYRVFNRQTICNSDVSSRFLKLSFTHAEKRDLLRLRDYFQRENADETFRTHTILRKGVKIVENLLFHAFTFVSWKMGSETSRKFEHQVCPRAIFFLQSITSCMSLKMFEKLRQWTFPSPFYLVCVFSMRKSTLHAFLNSF